MSHSRKDCITFLMTTRCNLACSYCYLQHTYLEPQSINLQFAKQGLRDYFDHRESRHIRFFGAGEPTLEFQKMVAIRDFAYELAGDSLKVEVQTNGVFPLSVAHWLSMNTNIVWFSLDGPPELHDSMRFTKRSQKTSHIIERNIKYLLNHNQNIMVGVRSTITELNIYKQEEMLRYFYNLGIRVVYSDPVFPPVEESSARVNKKESKDFNLEYAREYIKARSLAENLGIFYGSIFTVNFDEKTELFCRSCLPSPHLTTDGFVSCCDMAYSGNILPELIYGRFNSDTGLIEYNLQKIIQIQMRKASNLMECKDCEILYHCAGTCFGEGVNETGNILGVKKDYCEAIKFLAKHILPSIDGQYPYLHP